MRGFEATDLTLTNGEVASLVSQEYVGYSVLEGNEAVQYYAVWDAVIQPESGYTGEFTVSMAAGVVQDFSGNTNLPTDTDTQYTTTVSLQQRGATGSPITGFTLFDNAAGGADVQALTDGLALATLSSERLNVRAEVAPGAKIGSVRMELSGHRTSSRTEGIAPYALFGDRGGQAFPAGTYTVTATPYPELSLGGTPRPARSVTFTVVSGDGGAPSVTVTSAAEGPVSGEFAVTVRFSEPVTGFRMSELAVTNGRATRMASLTDGTGHAAEHEVYVTPDPGAGGEVTVTVPAGVATDAAGNPNTASATFRIALPWDPLTGFTLFDNANGGADVRSLSAGAVVVVPASSQLNIRAGVRSGASIGSVRMTLSGAMSSSRTEGIAPYALFGDRGGRAFAPGTYTVTATPYPERNLGGAPGPALSVTFSAAATIEQLSTSGPPQIIRRLTAVETANDATPSDWSLQPNYPNPFNQGHGPALPGTPLHCQRRYAHLQSPRPEGPHPDRRPGPSRLSRGLLGRPRSPRPHRRQRRLSLPPGDQNLRTDAQTALLALS